MCVVCWDVLAVTAHAVMHQEQSLDLLPVQLHTCSTTGRCLHSQVPGRRRCLLSDGFQIFRGTIDFYGPRMYVHVCVHVNLCWAEYVCAHVSACVGPRMCVCVCACGLVLDRGPHSCEGCREQTLCTQVCQFLTAAEWCFWWKRERRKHNFHFSPGLGPTCLAQSQQKSLKSRFGLINVSRSSAQMGFDSQEEAQLGCFH